jgi:DNA-binding NarL/FixJ family response regulator
MHTIPEDLAPDHLALLHLLIVGGTRQTLARALHLSLRAVDVRIADLKRELATPDRFYLGARGVSQGWVDPLYPIAHARARRIGTGWVTPTVRQLDIVRRRGSGAAVAEVAAAIGVSKSTVRRELAGLAAVNGALNAVHAGALFQALEWVGPLPPRAGEPRP